MIVQLVQLPFLKTTKVGQFFIEQNHRLNRKIVQLVRLVRLYFTFLLTEKKFKFNRGMVNCAKKLDKSDKSDNFRAKLLISWNKKVSNFMPKLSNLSDFLTNTQSLH
jgi:hypothetical protein